MNKLLPLIASLSLAATVLAQPPPQGESETSPMMQQMQTRMAQMHAQMERIHQTQDPVERRRLMEEHRAAMRENMSMMSRMMREETMPQRGRMRECPPGDTECRLERMEARHAMMAQHMQMMHQMMEQMMGGIAEGEPSESGAEHEEHD